MTISSEIRAVHSALSSCGGIMVVKHTDRPIEVLDSRHIMTMILFLHENGPSKRVDIYGNVSRNSNMPEKIGALLESGIISETPTATGAVLALTDSGRAVANMLLSIESVLKVGSDIERCRA